MRRLRLLVDHELQVVKPEWLKYQYEIRFGDETVARLVFPKAMSRNARATCAEGEWLFEPVSTMKNTIRIMLADGGEEIALYQPHVWSGKHVLQLTDGEKFLIRSNAFQTTTRLFLESGGEIAGYQSTGTFTRTTSLVMNRINSRVSEFHLLVLFTLYAHVSPSKDSH